MLFARREKIDHFDYVVVIIEMQDGEQHKLYNVAVFKLYSTESKKYYKYNKVYSEVVGRDDVLKAIAARNSIVKLYREKTKKAVLEREQNLFCKDICSADKLLIFKSNISKYILFDERSYSNFCDKAV